MNEEILYFIVCFLQPIILPLPEPVTIIGGSSILGPLKGATIGFTGTVLGIIVMFLIAKFARRSIINKIIDDKKIDKFNKYIQKNETIIILMLFVLPILPDEVICIGAGLAKMNSYKFIGIATMSKLVTSISLAYSLELINFNPIYIAISIVLIIGISIIKKIKLCIS
ncbi:VTT domain-containing protein [Clostridium nigeriense]|uniref:VTT domain-containing protein n=1 Tax=Clostridium nigeriense TaxID=1805470 RepID=UPI0008378A66|nr:VTT domain-containing protein [Clostridium nigeriense]